MRDSINPDLSIQGIVLTMFDGRNNLANQVVDDVRAHMGDKVYETVIPRNVRVSEAPSYGKPAILYDLKCAGSQAYLQLASEVIRRERQPACRVSVDSASKRLRLTYERRSSKKRLGRGLAALIGEMDQPRRRPSQGAGGAPTARVPIEFVIAQPEQPAPAFRRCRA